MLINVHVKNLALIREADIYFNEGLNILSGETGAGKSIIIGSILIALGAKIPKDILRDDEKEALIEVVFQLKNESIKDKIEELGYDLGDERQIIISRKIISGRSIIKINGENVTVTNAKKITELLIDIHGQHDHQSLLKLNKQLEILDNYAIGELKQLKSQLSQEYKKYTDLKKEYQEYDIDNESRNREIAFCKFEIDEIDRANLIEGEYESVEKKFKKISSFKNIAENMNEIYSLIGDTTFDGVSERVGNASKIIQGIRSLDDGLQPIADSILDLDSICQDVSHMIKDYVDQMAFDEEEAKMTEDRMNELNHLSQKYCNTKGQSDIVKNILEYRDEQVSKLQKMENFEKMKLQCENQLKEQVGIIENISNKVSEIRKKNANLLANEIENVLKGLNFLDVRFDIHFRKLNSYTANGNDEVEFMISTNPGEDVKPLSAIASGGELSRIMLGIKTIMAEKDDIETLVFDEIDTGISGKTAQMVAERMKEVSKSHQIICITHLPQIAAMADSHYLIEKKIINDKTVTEINLLNDEDSVKELARMLSGSKMTEAVIENAREMKKLANN